MQIPDQMIPTKKPEWLAKWPAKPDYIRKFPDGIRLHYIRTGAPRVSGINFSDNGLLLSIDGRFQVQWLLQNDEWARKCSCNYPKDTCVHAWYATIVMEYICRVRNWSTSSSKSRERSIPSTKPAKKIDSSASYSHKQNSSQMELPFGVPEKTRESASVSLDIEADFKLNPGKVTLRFYEVKNGRRAILRMQRLYNLAQTASMKKSLPYRQRDVDFLNWVRHQIEGKHVWQNNLQVLKLLPTKFDDWVQAWKHEPDRILDRETQKPLALKVSASLHFEILPEIEKTRIKCFVGTSRQNREEFHRVFPSIREMKKCLLNGVNVNLELAVTWQTLVDCFSKKSPAMPTEMLCQHLPVILEGRLDLLTGKNITHIEEDVDLEMRVRTDQGKLIFEAVKEGKVFSENGYADSQMKEENGSFKVTTYKSPVLDALRKVPSQMNPGGLQTCSFNQSEKMMEKLLDYWPSVDVPKSASGSLGSIMDSHKPEMQMSLKENRNWLDYTLQWQVGDVSLTHDEMKYISETDKQLYRTASGQWINVDLGGVRDSMEKLKKNNIHKGSGSRLAMDGKQLLDQLENQVKIQPSCLQLAEKIRTAAAPAPPIIPEALSSILRPYQKEGVEFMHHRLSYNLGVVLADDMGLGKTLQTLALIGSQKSKKPVLVVAPSSVVFVWQDEVKKFIPGMNVEVITGAREKRAKVLSKASDFDIMITSYHLVRNDLETLKKIDFSMVVLDEAQFTKNPSAKITQAVKTLQSDKRLALSGTPVENRLSDLWSIFDFLNPGFLGSLEKFNLNYEQGGASRQELAARVRPLIIRRTKEKVAKELPPRTEELIRCSFNEEQANLYRTVLKNARREVREQGFSIFAALTRLRQTCCDPRLLKNAIQEYTAEHSAKLKCLLDMVGPIIEEGHSVLIFSQFTSMLEIIESELDKLKLTHFKLTGSTPTAKRPALIKEFNDCEDPSAFLLSLKAAGTGLTLTKADYVFIYDPWWNPAAEQQAIDRTHRIGQDKPVFVYKLAVSETVEDKILKLQEDKKQMVADVLEDDAVPTHLTANELAGLLEDV